jgi:uncharacterized protein YdcH (DUF465 family)
MENTFFKHLETLSAEANELSQAIENNEQTSETKFKATVQELRKANRLELNQKNEPLENKLADIKSQLSNCTKKSELETNYFISYLKHVLTQTTNENWESVTLTFCVKHTFNCVIDRVEGHMYHNYLILIPSSFKDNMQEFMRNDDPGFSYFNEQHEAKLKDLIDSGLIIKILENESEYNSFNIPRHLYLLNGNNKIKVNLSHFPILQTAVYDLLAQLVLEGKEKNKDLISYPKEETFMTIWRDYKMKIIEKQEEELARQKSLIMHS